MEIFFEQIKNSPIKDFGQKKILKYSIIPMLFWKIREKELLHSEIIESILIEGIKLKCGDKLIKCFFNELKIAVDTFETESLIIETEKVISNNRRIDILITWDSENQDKRNAIIIENKLNNAIDQPKQLEDYYCEIQKEFLIKKIVYIPASETKFVNRDTISDDIDNLLITVYPTNLINWLNQFISEEIHLNPNYKKALEDYIMILNLTNMENERIKENFELRDILAKDESYIMCAHKIHEKWRDIKWHTEWDFWNDFENHITNNDDTGYQILKGQKYSAENLNNAIHRIKNRCVHYGITFKIAEREDLSICLSIERGWEKMYYGIILKNKKEEWCNSNNPIFQELRKIANQINYSALPATDNNLWITSKYFTKDINFDFFGTEDTLKLINKDFRDKVIEECWNEITNLIFDFNGILKNKTE